MPGRAISSEFLDGVEAGTKHPKICPVNCIKTCDISTAPYCIIASLTAALKGNFKNGYAFAGSNVWRTDKIVTVKELFSTLIQEFNEYRSKINLALI
jgi:NAD(P)H-dependent flavin oxidoreductase YrpB (nitropropane dioxygenase family)